jgi:hypothetical protein
MADINRKWPWPANVGVLGTFPEEVKALQKSVEKNIDASPLAEAAPTRLLTPNVSSDNLRMGEQFIPPEIAENTALPLTHVVFRRLLMKSRRKGVLRFDEAVEDENLDDLPPSRRDQMISMLAREGAMLEIIERYNALAEAVYMRLISESKG